MDLNDPSWLLLDTFVCERIPYDPGWFVCPWKTKVCQVMFLEITCPSTSEIFIELDYNSLEMLCCFE